MILRPALLDSVVEVSGPAALLRRVADLLPCMTGEPTAAVEVVPTPGGLLVRGDGLELRAGDDGGAVEAVLLLVNRIVLAQVADVAVHAGVVARSGSAVAFPGVSGAGKSTLTAACLQAGWDYVSDEALVLANDGAVRAYPRPLSLLPWALDRLALAPAPRGRAERTVTAAELGATATSGGLRLDHVVSLVRRPGPARLQAQPAPVSAVLLLRHAFNHYVDPQRAVTVAAAAARGGWSWRLEYDDPVEAAALLSRNLPVGPPLPD